MIWQNGELVNPLSGKLLTRDAHHSFSDGDARFPVIDEIPFLRAERDQLNAEVLCALDSGDKQEALTLLLQDQDDWAKSAPPTAADLKPLLENSEINLRAAMQCLKYGAVADYFAYRWSDPTFLSGLALLEWHLPNQAKNVFELCCGIGHYLREFALRGIAATGADVVFSKLWLARKFVAPMAKLVCADANFALPFADKAFDAVFCHDAFYFLPNKCLVADELKRVTNGAILIGHAHNSEADNYSSGAAVSIDEYKQFFDDPILYDDVELMRAVIENRKPESAKAVEALKKSPAVAIIVNGGEAIRNIAEFDLPDPAQSLLINPLLDGGEYQVLPAPHFPSERYASEYAELSSYLCLNDQNVSFSDQEMAFYGHWRSDERLRNLVRRRIFVDLPEDW